MSEHRTKGSAEGKISLWTSPPLWRWLLTSSRRLFPALPFVNHLNHQGYHMLPYYRLESQQGKPEPSSVAICRASTAELPILPTRDFFVAFSKTSRVSRWNTPLGWGSPHPAGISPPPGVPYPPAFHPADSPFEVRSGIPNFLFPFLTGSKPPPPFGHLSLRGGPSSDILFFKIEFPW